MNNDDLPLPECGMLIGSAVYLDRADYVFQHTGPYYTSWVSENHPPEWYLNKIIEDNQGNLAVIWDGGTTRVCLKAMADWMDLAALGHKVPEPDWDGKRFLIPEDWSPITDHPERFGAGFHKLVAKAEELGLRCYSIYSEATPEWVEKISANNGFIGYNMGEKFSFDIEGVAARNDFRAEKTKLTKNDDLHTLADNFERSVRGCFAEKKRQGWKRFLITSASFHLDAEIAAAQCPVVPHVEGFAFKNLNFGAALCRGLHKQFALPSWGQYLAHEHYSFLPYASKHKFATLDAAFHLAYMNGSKITVLESGNWWQQSDHVDDTAMHDTPKIDLGRIAENDPPKYAHLVTEARKHYSKLGYDSEVCRQYRSSLSKFHDFVKREGTPEGQPEITIAAIKGRHDFCSQSFHPNMAIAGAYRLAETNPFWYEGQPERSWEIFRNVFYPLAPAFKKHANLFFSGTPYGMTDVVSFAGEPSSEFLVENYKALLFTGWNTATHTQYETLKAYVQAGGTLFAAIPHFSMNADRNFVSYTTSDLINDGDLSELCGVKVKQRGRQSYWFLAAENNCLGLPKHKHFGPFATHIGDVDIVGSPEIIAVHDETFAPVLIRHRYGKGLVYFLNSWEYPGALDVHAGPGAERASTGLVGEVYKRVALDNPGTVRITDDGIHPGENCDHVAFSYFPSDGRVCLLNMDFENERVFHLHAPTGESKIHLDPAEFRVETT